MIQWFHPDRETGGWRQRQDDFAQYLVHRDGGGAFEISLARARVRQDVVQHVLHSQGAAPDQIQALGGLRPELQIVLQDELREGADGAQRRAQIMRSGVDELVELMNGVVELAIDGLEFQRRTMQRRDVRDQHIKPLNLPALGEIRHIA